MKQVTAVTAGSDHITPKRSQMAFVPTESAAYWKAIETAQTAVKRQLATKGLAPGTRRRRRP